MEAYEVINLSGESEILDVVNVSGDTIVILDVTEQESVDANYSQGSFEAPARASSDLELAPGPRAPLPSPAFSLNSEDGLADYHLMLARASPQPHQNLWRPPTPYLAQEELVVDVEEELVDAAPHPLAEPPAALTAPYLIPGPVVVPEEEPQEQPIDLTIPPLVVDLDDEDDEPQQPQQEPQEPAAVAYWPAWHQPEPRQEEPVDLRQRIRELRARHGDSAAPQPHRLQHWRSQAPASGRVAIVIPLPKKP